MCKTNWSGGLLYLVKWFTVCTHTDNWHLSKEISALITELSSIFVQADKCSRETNLVHWNTTNYMPTLKSIRSKVLFSKRTTGETKSFYCQIVCLQWILSIRVTVTKQLCLNANRSDLWPNVCQKPSTHALSFKHGATSWFYFCWSSMLQCWKAFSSATFEL